FRTAATVLSSRTGGELACSNFLLFNQQVTPLTFIAELRAPHAPVGELEEHGRVRSAGRLDAPDCVIRFRCHTALPFIASGEWNEPCNKDRKGLRGHCNPCAHQ